RMGTIAKLQVKALEPENKNVGIRDIFRNGLQFVPEENEMRAFQEGVLNVDFDKVRAIGDIMLIDPQDIQRQTQATQNHQQGQVPNREPQQPTQ
ncbi:hypothetical protein, partial [uncultured Methanobrevibacter sp.]